MNRWHKHRTTFWNKRGYINFIEKYILLYFLVSLIFFEKYFLEYAIFYEWLDNNLFIIIAQNILVQTIVNLLIQYIHHIHLSMQNNILSKRRTTAWYKKTFIISFKYDIKFQEGKWQFGQHWRRSSSFVRFDRMKYIDRILNVMPNQFKEA